MKEKIKEKKEEEIKQWSLKERASHIQFLDDEANAYQADKSSQNDPSYW